VERATFLIESSGTRISCLLNPESVVMRRVAGLRPRHSAGGKLAGTALRDDPIIVIGGGRTEIDLDLLFDVDLAGSSTRGADVRDLTRPLWELTEARPVAQPVEPVLFIWGKAWNIPVLVAALSERLERFDTAGRPSRSWLRVRMLRVDWASGGASERRPEASALAVRAAQTKGAGAVEQAMLTSEFMTGTPAGWREFVE
jgi:hypothetical protein